jgi:ribosome-associated translation inhibitor RaiA
MVHPVDPATVEDSLQIQGDLHRHEIISMIEHWSKLDARLRSFKKGSVELHLFVKERETPSQHVTLEAKIDGRPPLVATSDSGDLGRALNEVRDEMIRQITDAKNRTEPRHNRHLRPSR